MQLDALPEFYRSRLSRFESELKARNRTLVWSSLIRFFVFLLTAFGMYYSFPESLPMLLILAVGTGLFLYLVSRHTDLKRSQSIARAKQDQAQRELHYLDGQRLSFDDGAELMPHAHAYAHDIDLFGPGSFYQYINRTELQSGKLALAGMLCANDISQIPEKQAGLQELSRLSAWREEFAAVSRLVDTEADDRSIIAWVQGYQPFVPKAMAWLPWVFSGLSALCLLAYAMGWLGGAQVGLWFGLGLVITGRFLAKVNGLSSEAGRAQSTFEAYNRLVSLLEEAPFESTYLQSMRSSLLSDEGKTSEQLKALASRLAALDQRNNMLFGIIGNGFLLWDLRQSYHIETWLAQHGTKVEAWFAAIADFDALCSLAGFVFNHPHYTWPEISPEAAEVLSVDHARHPLIDRAKSIGNPVQVAKEDFHIITGANMAGKSTYLRTVSLQIVMANMGLPVCADRCRYAPIKLISSMRSVDSLSEDTSYFFSELKRLKFIVDQLEQEPYFVILDEILKGTNSTDKAEGSRRFVKRLVLSGSTGFIATHDLSLCDLSDELAAVSNYYLDAEIVNNELSFDYKLKQGVCQNMNASFLLEKMGLV